MYYKMIIVDYIIQLSCWIIKPENLKTSRKNEAAPYKNCTISVFNLVEQVSTKSNPGCTNFKVSIVIFIKGGTQQPVSNLIHLSIKCTGINIKNDID